MIVLPSSIIVSDNKEGIENTGENKTKWIYNHVRSLK